jgi:hypothetical protein
MGPEITIAMLIAAWLAVASAMLWGVMRISRRHHYREIGHEKPTDTENRYDPPPSNSFRLR